MPESIDGETINSVLSAYAEAYDENDGKDEWFARMKALCETLGFTTDMKKFRKDPEFASRFKGTIGDFSTIIRVAVTGKRNTPDLWSIMQILGREEVVSRLTEIYFRDYYKEN